MYREAFFVVKDPSLHLLECEGDVAIEGWEEAFGLGGRTQAFPPWPVDGVSEELIEVEEEYPLLPRRGSW